MNESLSTELSTANSFYESASTSFAKAGKEDPYLEKLIRDIEAASRTLDTVQQKYVDANDIVRGDYWTAGNNLANLLVQYRFYQESQVKNIDTSTWEQNKNNGNNVKVTYTDSIGNKQEAYFDYITIDRDGNALMDNEGHEIRGVNNAYSRANNISGIMVVKKTPVYDRNGNLAGFTTDTSDVKHEYQNYHGETKDGNFADKGYVYFTIKDFEKGVDNYHKERSDVTSVSESASTLKSESESLSQSDSLSRSASESSSDDFSNSVSDSLKTSESDSKSRSESFSDSASKSESASTSESESISESASISESQSEMDSLSQEDSESKSESTSKSASTSRSESNSISESTSKSASTSRSESNSISESTSKSASEECVNVQIGEQQHL